MNYDVFNLLHDGIIKQINGSVPGDIELIVECEYLRERLEPAGKNFFLNLKNCTHLYFLDNTKLTNLTQIAQKELSLLSSELVNNETVIYCGTGEVHLAFEDCAVFLTAGVPITEDAVAANAEAYWDEWSGRPR